MSKLTVGEARKIDLVDYLFSLGFQAIKTKGEDYWYLSPFRNERTPSFKINRKSNIWYDHGSGEGGNIIDFGIIYHHLKVGDFLQLLAKDFQQNDFSFHPQSKKQHGGTVAGEKEKATDSKIIVTATRPLSNIRLLHYLEARAISPEHASQYCQEVDFSLYKKQHTAIGFPNGKGGYELRNSYFKGSSSPKTFRFFSNGAKELHVFEGFFDFLSWHSHFQKTQAQASNFLILNSLSFFRRAKETMESHNHINLWLDRGTAGQACTTQAIKSHPAYVDKSNLYKGFDDLNEWLIEQAIQKQNLSNSIKQSNSKTIKRKRYDRF